MKDIISHKLDSDIAYNNKEYFFTFLSDRFEYMNVLWTKALSKRFDKKFEPISILSCKQNKFFEKRNYIIINKILKLLNKKLNNDNLVYLEDYEDTNLEFSKSGFIKNLIKTLLKKQNTIFILCFTSANLKIKTPGVTILGPDPEITTKFDNKVEHVKLFEKLGLPRNKTRLYKNLDKIKKSEKYPFFISASYTSGGNESRTIYTETDLDTFYADLRELNKKSIFVVADLITDIINAPNVNAIVTDKDDTRIICISDQILRGNKYLGNVYPSKVSSNQKDEIISVTKKVGNYLSVLGFRGIFGIDFLIDKKGQIFTTDLNPRRQGGYLCNVLMSKPDIVEMELDVALGKKPAVFDHDDFQPKYAWAHSKIKPYQHNTKIKNSFVSGVFSDPFKNLGSMFCCIFYPENHIFVDGNVGYFITTGKTHDEVKDKTIKESEIILSKNLETYEGL